MKQFLFGVIQFETQNAHLDSVNLNRTHHKHHNNDMIKSRKSDIRFVKIARHVAQLAPPVL